MKVKHFFLLIAIGYIIAALSACSDSKDTPLPELESGLFSSDKLEISYDNADVPGKWARLDINADGKSAVVTFGQTLDLSSAGLGLSGSIQGPSPVPGSATLSIPVSLTPADGAYTMSGSFETPDVTFNYQGTLTAEKLTFAFTDCKLKSQAFAGSIFAPAPLEKINEFQYTSTPFHLVWELDPAAGVEIPLSQILNLAATAPVIPVYNNTAYTSIAQLFSSAFKTLALLPSGNVPIMFVSTLGGAAHVATSNPAMIQYVPDAAGLKLFVNPLSVFSQFLLYTSDNKDDAQFDFSHLSARAPAPDASASQSASATASAGYAANPQSASPASTRADSNASASTPALSDEMKKAFIASLLKALAPQIQNGIPLAVSLSTEGAAIYFDTATSVNFLASLLQDLLSDPTIAAALQKYLASADIPNVSPEQLASLFKDIPQYLKATTRLEIGLSLIPYK